MIGLRPAILTAYPGDSVSLSVATTYPPPLMVTDGSSALLNSDYSLTLNNTTFQGYRGGLELRSGSGSAKWTLTSQSLPGASESIGFLMGVKGTDTSSILDIRFSSTQYKTYDGAGLIRTVSYAAQSGDQIKLTVDGASLRAYINDVLVETKTYTSKTPYPVRIVPTTFAALATSPSGYRMPAAELTGDWQCAEDYVDWNVPSSLASDYSTTDAQRTAVFTVGAVPGTYTVTGIVGAAFALDVGGTDTGADTVFGVTSAFSVNRPIQFGRTPGHTLPGGLSENTTYYVKTYAANAISVSLTPGGATVDITSAGTGGWVAPIGDIALQGGTATIIVPGFDVLGIPQNNVIEIPAGGTALFKTTYDAAQNFNNGSYVTRTVVTGGGGSFNSTTHVYTAPNTAGDYTIRFESNNQRRDFTVRVPTTLLPVGEPVYPGEARTNTTTMAGSLNWSATGGVSLSGSGQSRNWTAPSTIGQIVRIAVDNGTLFRHQDYVVTNVLPVSYQLITDVKTGPRTIIEELDGGRNYFSRTLTESGFVPWEAVVQCVLSVADFNTLVAFNDTQLRNGSKFILTDYLLDSVRRIVRFDSVIENQRTTNDCLVACSFRVKAV